MNSENIKGRQDMGVQVVSKRETQGKSGEIFTIRFADSQPAYAANSRPTDECGPDLFFALWDFSGTP